MYGIIIASGVLISLLVGEKLVKEKKLDANVYWGASLWVILGGVVGARLYHVMNYWEIYAADPIEVLMIHRGGLGIYGAVIGGTISSVSYLLLSKNDILKYLDLAFVVMPLGQAIGRWGNFVNKEVLGTPTDLPWGMHVPLPNRPPHLTYNDTYHPLFLYESLLDILLFFALWLLYRRKSLLRKRGPLLNSLADLKGFFTLSYFTGYGIIRFSLEFIRLESWQIQGFNVAQMISLLFVLGGLFGIYRLYNKAKP